MASASSVPPTKGDQLLRYEMLDDPSLAMLFAQPAAPELRLLDLDEWPGNAADGQQRPGDRAGRDVAAVRIAAW